MAQIGGLLPELAVGLPPFNGVTGTAILGVAIIVVVWRRPRPSLLLLVSPVVAILLALGQRVPLGTGRGDIYLYPVLALIVGVAVDVVPRPGVRTLVASALIGSLALAAPGAAEYPDWGTGRLADLVDQRLAAHDRLLVHPFGSFVYGLSTALPVSLHPAGDDWATSHRVVVHDPRVVMLPFVRSDPASFGDVVRGSVNAHARVWFLASHMSRGTGEALARIRGILWERGFSMVRSWQGERARPFRRVGAAVPSSRSGGWARPWFGCTDARPGASGSAPEPE